MVGRKSKKKGFWGLPTANEHLFYRRQIALVHAVVEEKKKKEENFKKSNIKNINI